MKIPSGAIQDARKLFDAGQAADGGIASPVQSQASPPPADPDSVEAQIMAEVAELMQMLSLNDAAPGTQEAALPAAPNLGSAPASSGAPAPASASSNGSPAPTNSQQDVINGDATQGAKSTDKAPAGMTADDIAKLDGGLEGKTGDQTLKGAGADGIKGAKDIQSIVGNQVQGGLSGTDADKAWQKLEVEEEAKNAPQANGKQASADVRHNGNMSGLQPSHEVASNSDIAFLQNEAKGQKTKGGASDKMNANDGETTGAQQVGQKILDGLGEAAKWLGKIAAKVFPEFAPEIKLAAAGIDVGLHAAGAAADKQDVGAAAKKTAEDELSPASLLS